MISEFKWTKKARITVAILCVALTTASLMILSQMNQVAEATILTPIEPPPGTIFYDDFSGDLGQWTKISETWSIENGELSGTGSSWTIIVAGDIGWNDYVLEAKVKPISRYEGTADSNHAPGILARYKDLDNFLMLYLHQGGTAITLGAKVAGKFIGIANADFVWSNDNWYTLKLEVAGLIAEAYVNGQSLFSASIPPDLANGKMGVEAYNSHAHFDDVHVSGVGLPEAYSLNVRAGITQIVVTCSWSGSGDITIANLTRSPTEAYYESDMSIYEKTNAFASGTGTSISNVKRAALSVAASASSEIWTLYLNLNGVTTYQVSVETT